MSASWDGTGSWRMFDNLAIGQFYQIGLDMRDPYYVCGGLQDNDSWCGPSQTLSIHRVRNHDWYEVWGGDGFYNVIDPTDHTIVFTKSQGGNLGRYDVTTGERFISGPFPARGPTGIRANSTASLGTRPSSCRVTTRPPFSWAPIFSCAHATADTHGKR